MDRAGAERLRWHIEQQTHWRAAPAVHDGRQPATDPDSAELVRLEEGVRFYRPRFVHGLHVQPCKRLVGEVWQSETVPADPDCAESTLRAGPR